MTQSSGPWSRTAAIALLKNALGWAWSRVPRQPRAEVPLPSHTLADACGVVAELCAGPRPDIPRLVDFLLHQAIAARASDVHLVPYEGFVSVRFRVDGILKDVAELPEGVRRSVSGRLKVLSRLITYVQDRPQDGRFEFRAGKQPMDVRIAFMPTLHGERIVLRMVRAAQSSLTLGDLVQRGETSRAEVLRLAPPEPES